MHYAGNYRKLNVPKKRFFALILQTFPFQSNWITPKTFAYICRYVSNTTTTLHTSAMSILNSDMRIVIFIKEKDTHRARKNKTHGRQVQCIISYHLFHQLDHGQGKKDDINHDTIDHDNLKDINSNRS